MNSIRFEVCPPTTKADWWSPELTNPKKKAPRGEWLRRENSVARYNKSLGPPQPRKRSHDVGTTMTWSKHETKRPSANRKYPINNKFFAIKSFTPHLQVKLFEIDLCRYRSQHNNEGSLWWGCESEYSDFWWWALEHEHDDFWLWPRKERKINVKPGYKLVCRKAEGRTEKQKERRHIDAERRKIEQLRDSVNRHRQIELHRLEVGDEDDWKALSFYNGYESGAPYNIFREVKEPPSGVNRAQFKKWKQAARTQQRDLGLKGLAWLNELDPIEYKRRPYMPKQTERRRLETIDQKVEFAISAVGGWAYLAEVPKLVKDKYGDIITPSQARRVKDRLVKAGRATTEDECGPHGKKIIIRLFYEKSGQGLPIAPIAEGVESATE